MAGEIAPITAAPVAPTAAVSTPASGGAHAIASAAPISTPIAPVAVEPVAAPVAEVAPLAAPVEAPTILETAAEPVVEPIADAPTPEVKAEGEPTVEAPEAPPALTYEAFKLPDGFSPADEQIGAFTTLIGEHQVPQETAQKLIDLHTSELQKFATQQAAHQQEAFDKMQSGWVKSMDKEFGNERDTVMNNARSAIVKFLPNEKQREEFKTMLRITGAGNHPAMLRFANAAFKAVSERGAPAPSVPRKGNGGQPWDNRYSGQGT